MAKRTQEKKAQDTTIDEDDDTKGWSRGSNIQKPPERQPEKKEEGGFITR